MSIFEAEIITKSPEQTREFAAEFAGSNISPGCITALRGDLGAGKTCFAQGIAWGLGLDRNVYLSSPTFAIVKEYRGRMNIFHIDLYRLESREEAFDIGIEEYFAEDAAAIIEWPEKIEILFKHKNVFTVDIKAISPDERSIRIYTGY